MSKKRRIALRIARQSTLSVDREKGIIGGVSVITEVPEANGHGFAIDGTTLKQVADAINASERGITSRLTHAELEEIDPIRVLAGRFMNARIEGGKVLADFHVGKYAQHSPQGNLGEYLLALAEEAPDAAGVSIQALDYEIEHGALRVLTLDNIDWVGSPAANPGGMLCDPCSPSYYDPLQGNGMNNQQIDFLRNQGLPWDASEEQTVAFIEALSDDQKNQLKALATSSAITDAINSATEGVAMSANPTNPNGSAAAGTSAEGAAQQPAAGATNPAQSTPAAEGANLASKPAANTAAPRTVDHAALSELNDLAVLSDLGGDWAMKMALEGVSLADARKAALAAKAAKRAPVALAGSGVTVGADLNLSTLQQAVSDALALKAGNGYDVPEFDPTGRPIMLSRGTDGGRIKTRQPHDRASQFRYLGLCDMGRQFLIAQGYRDAAYLSKPQLASLLLNRHKLREHCSRLGINLAMGTTDFSSLLADSMGKSLRQAYVVQPATWPLWARKATAPDFKTQRRVQLSEAPTLTAIVEGQEYAFGSVSDAGETYTLSKYGTGLIFTWQSMVNDDTDAFSRLPTLMGRAAARIVETTAIGVLTGNATMSDSVAIFATAHGNLSTGTPSVASLGAARAKMRMQTPLGGTSAQALGTMPRTVLCPEELAITFGQLIGSQVDPAKSNATPNPFMNVLNVASSPLLSSSSAIIWYLIADPNEIDTVDVCFLEGEEGPVVEEEIDFSSDDMKIKVRQTCAAKAIDYRGMVRSSGA